MPAAIHREVFQLHRRSSGNYVGQRLNTEKPEKKTVGFILFYVKQMLSLQLLQQKL